VVLAGVAPGGWLYADDAGPPEFHGMEPEILRKALNVLVREGRATIFGSDDSLGVKFVRS
jgi:ESCRT-II complex subunit VPS25